MNYSIENPDDEPLESAWSLDRFSAAIGSRHVEYAILFVLIVSILVANGGLLHGESGYFIAQHLSGKPMLALLYNSRELDNGLYQARELSYLLDRLDCFFIACSTGLGIPHFLSLIHYTFSLFASVLAWHLFVRHFLLDRLVSLLLVLLFVTSPTLFLQSFYLRSSKIGVTLLLVLLAFQIVPALLAPAEKRVPYGTVWRGVLFTFLCLLMTLLDRQGFFFAVLLAAFSDCFARSPSAGSTLFSRSAPSRRVS